MQNLKHIYIYRRDLLIPVLEHKSQKGKRSDLFTDIFQIPKILKYLFKWILS